MRLRALQLGFSVVSTLRTALPEGFTAPLDGWVSPAAKRQPKRRAAWLVAAVPAACLLATWIGIQSFPWFGPMVADNLRLVLGTENVARLEGLAADVEDRVRLTVGSQTARGLSEYTPAEVLTPVASPAVPTAPGLPSPAFRPANVKPMFPAVASAEDGAWQPVHVPGRSEPVIYRTILHPDAKRAHAELFVFAVDLQQTQLHAAPGTIEPKHLPTGRNVERPGLVEPEHMKQLVAAFNGGFKAEHGQFGMKARGTVLLPPKAGSCTLAQRDDGAVRIAPWTALQSEQNQFVFWRQTPACMAEGGALHPLLVNDSKNWGATVDGDTVIRRSAVGLDASGRTLFVGISNSTTARALATGMLHAGARDVAQLDVNHSFPKFLLYRSDAAGQLTAMTAVKGFLYEKDEYVRRPSTRDFFYVTLR